VTSNQAPDALMPNPLFHAMFEPTIALIRDSMTVVAVDGPVDYRTMAAPHGATGFTAGRWIFPSDDAHLRSNGLRRPDPADATVLDVRGRTIRALRVRDEQVWFHFDDLCARPTAPSDYETLARRFPWWVVSGTPNPARLDQAPARRLVNLVDILYDRDIRTDLVADISRRAFTDRSATRPELARTVSRLYRLGADNPAQSQHALKARSAD
jgi:cell division protein ZapE